MPKSLVVNKKGSSITNSRLVSWKFEKGHDQTLRDIRNLKEKVSLQFWRANFFETTYKSRGKEYPMYEMTKDGFTMLVMGYTGKQAMIFKEEYIKRFNEMENYITSSQLAKMEFPALTDNIKLMHEEPKFYHFSNECDLINRIVLGKTAKQFKIDNNIDVKTSSIREHLTSDQIYYIEKLQHVDVGFVLAIPDFHERKKALKRYYQTLKKDREQSLIE